MQYFQNIYFPLFDNIVEGTIIPALIKYSIYVLFIMHYLSQACHNPTIQVLLFSSFCTWGNSGWEIRILRKLVFELSDQFPY